MDTKSLEEVEHLLAITDILQATVDYTLMSETVTYHSKKHLLSVVSSLPTKFCDEIPYDYYLISIMGRAHCVTIFQLAILFNKPEIYTDNRILQYEIELLRKHNNVFRNHPSLLITWLQTNHIIHKRPNANRIIASLLVLKHVVKDFMISDQFVQYAYSNNNVNDKFIVISNLARQICADIREPCERLFPPIPKRGGRMLTYVRDVLPLQAQRPFLERYFKDVVFGARHDHDLYKDFATVAIPIYERFFTQYMKSLSSLKYKTREKHTKNNKILGRKLTPFKSMLPMLVPWYMSLPKNKRGVCFHVLYSNHIYVRRNTSKLMYIRIIDTLLQHPLLTRVMLTNISKNMRLYDFDQDLLNLTNISGIYTYFHVLSLINNNMSIAKVLMTNLRPFHMTAFIKLVKILDRRLTVSGRPNLISGTALLSSMSVPPNIKRIIWQSIMLRAANRSFGMCGLLTAFNNVETELNEDLQIRMIWEPRTQDHNRIAPRVHTYDRLNNTFDSDGVGIYTLPARDSDTIIKDEEGRGPSVHDEVLQLMWHHAFSLHMFDLNDNGEVDILHVDEQNKNILKQLILFSTYALENGLYLPYKLSKEFWTAMSPSVLPSEQIWRARLDSMTQNGFDEKECLEYIPSQAVVKLMKSSWNVRMKNYNILIALGRTMNYHELNAMFCRDALSSINVEKFILAFHTETTADWKFIEFRDTLLRMSPEELRILVKFITGKERLPSIQHGEPKIQITWLNYDPDHPQLVKSYNCTNQLFMLSGGGKTTREHLQVIFDFKNVFGME